MREELLYHLWKFQKFKSVDLKSSDGETIQVIHPGFQNDLAGPDFFNARVQISDQLWAGNVEMHLKSSDWYFHQHETDPNYDNVILHVVWEHDVEIYRKDNSVIPTLSLKNKIEPNILDIYSELLEKPHARLNCERDFHKFTDFQLAHWMERLYFERLEEKSTRIIKLLSETGNNWEAVMFIMLARAFGSKVNSEVFMDIARNIDFGIIKKLGKDQVSLEALFLGQSKLIQEVDQYGVGLSEKYEFLKHKFSLENDLLPNPQFFRLRPDNFPTIRLSQLAALYACNNSLFNELMKASSKEEIDRILKLEISDYWKSHYNFGKKHPARNKKLTRPFINLLIINCIIPLKYCYAQYLGQEPQKEIQQLLLQIDQEKNSAIQVYEDLRPKIASNAMDSQALLQLRSNYCNKNKCLQCELGVSLLRKSAKYI